MNVLLELFIIPVIAAVVSGAIKSSLIVRRTVSTLMWCETALAVYLLLPVFHGAKLPLPSDFLIDKTAAAFIILTIVVVSASVTHASTLYGQERQTHDPRMFFAFTSIFMVAMIAVFACDNLGFMWICIEASTLFSAPLVYMERTKNAVEATWKYVIICSVGIAFALLGTVMIFASGQSGHNSEGSLQITQLMQNAPLLDYPLLRLGFIFCFIGYGTKAGVFPLHNWLPDAYSEAPSPACAIFSGALINCALFGIYRISQVVMASKHGSGGFEMIAIAGGISAVAASLFLINQHNLKRMWAYSSIENVGIMLIAIGIGSGSLFLLQAINHAIAKVAIFLQSGNVIRVTGSKRLSNLHGLISFAPEHALLLALTTCAVMGVPPFGTFCSEISVLASTADVRYWGVALMMIFSLTVSFIAVAMHIGRVVCGTPRADYRRLPAFSSCAMPVLLLASSLALGFMFSPHIWNLLK